MKRALMAAVLSALVTAAVLATVGFGARHKSSTDQEELRQAATSRRHQPPGPPPTMKEALAAEEKRRAAQQAKLAKALGVTTDKLTAAQDAVKKKNLDQAVKDNQLTAAQRDAILACDKAPLTCDRSNLPAYGFHGGPGHSRRSRPVRPRPRHFRGGPRDRTSPRTSRPSSASPRTRSRRRSRPTGPRAAEHRGGKGHGHGARRPGLRPAARQGRSGRSRHGSGSGHVGVVTTRTPGDPSGATGDAKGDDLTVQ